MPKISVIIPCYNQGHFLDEAVQSVLAQSFQDLEIIIVNDGSTDENTIKLLANYTRLRTRVIHIPNSGVSAARNRGIQEAAGEYILPLDADDRIAPEYLQKALDVIEGNRDMGVVYCLAECFGAKAGRWNVPDFSPKGILFTNLVFCTALFRKTDWKTANGYNSNMSSGWEDWDFWLSMLETGRKFHRIPEVLFYYRIAECSRERSMDRLKQVNMHRQIIKNHPKLFPGFAIHLVSPYYLIRYSWPYRMAKKLQLPYLFSRISAGKR